MSFPPGMWPRRVRAGSTSVAAGLMLAGLLAILWLGLFSAFLSGFLVYFLIQFGVGWLGKFGVLPRVGRIVLALVIAVFVIGGLTSAIIALVSFLSNGQDNLGRLCSAWSRSSSNAKVYLPPGCNNMCRQPSTTGAGRSGGALRGNAAHLTVLGRGAGRAHRPYSFRHDRRRARRVSPPAPPDGPLARGLEERVRRVGHGLQPRRLLADQNFGAEHAAHRDLPRRRPAAHRPAAALHQDDDCRHFCRRASADHRQSHLEFDHRAHRARRLGARCGAGARLPVAIHKLEYVFNAQIIGTEIRAHAWEILLAMLVLEAAFGLKGLVAAPIFYAYLKDDLKMSGWV